MMEHIKFKRIRSVILIALVLLGTALYFGYSTITHRPQFDPKVIANAETAMWKAYYERDDTALAWNLIYLLRNQYGLTWWEAGNIGYLFAESAMKFRNGESNHETAILPDLIDAYRKIKEAAGAEFDPVKAARAELSWWVARRTKGLNSPQNVGKQISQLYQILYGGNQPSFQKAGLLRAQAADLRDRGGHHADWGRIEELLTESYSNLTPLLHA